MPNHIFPSITSGIDVDSHLDDFLLERDLEGIHGNVLPVQPIPIDFNYFRGKTAFWYSAKAEAGGKVSLEYPNEDVSAGQIVGHLKGGPAEMTKAFLYPHYDHVTFQAHPLPGFALLEWREGTVNGPVVGTQETLDVPYTSTEETYFAIFGSCDLEGTISSTDCTLRNGNVGTTPPPTVPTPTVPTPTVPTPTVPTPVDQTPVPVNQAPAPATPVPTRPPATSETYYRIQGCNDGLDYTASKIHVCKNGSITGNINVYSIGDVVQFAFGTNCPTGATYCGTIMSTTFTAPQADAIITRDQTVPSCMDELHCQN